MEFLGNWFTSGSWRCWSKAVRMLEGCHLCCQPLLTAWDWADLPVVQTIFISCSPDGKVSMAHPMAGCKAPWHPTPYGPEIPPPPRPIYYPSITQASQHFSNRKHLIFSWPWLLGKHHPCYRANPMSSLSSPIVSCCPPSWGLGPTQMRVYIWVSAMEGSVVCLPAARLLETG